MYIVIDVHIHTATADSFVEILRVKDFVLD